MSQSHSKIKVMLLALFLAVTLDACERQCKQYGQGF
jgi:hypothetical protein